MKKFKISLIAIAFIISTVVVAPAQDRDGKFYFNMLKQSMIEVVEKNQDLINTNPDGSVKNKNLTPKAYYKSTYKIFKTIIGADFSLKSLSGEKDPDAITKVLAALLQSGRVATAKAQKQINTEQDKSVKLKKFIPAVFGQQTAQTFYEKTGVAMKQTTLGKGAYGARNSGNAADTWEREQLKQFSGGNWPLNKGIGETVGNDYRFIKPIYIKKACLKCHGFEKGESGPYGHPKEGYVLNDIRGGISVLLPNH